MQDMMMAVTQIKNTDGPWLSLSHELRLLSSQAGVTGLSPISEAGRREQGLHSGGKH